MAQLRDLIVTGAARFVNGAYFGGASTFGSATRPVWWNNGFPQATTYSLSATLNAGSANRLAYYSGANAVSASSHYASATQVGINITNIDTIGSRALYVNGTSQFSDDIYANKSIRNLAVGGGLYWNPYVESATDNSDAASITLIKSGIAGGTELQIKQANDQTDVINLVAPYYIYLNNKRAFTVNDTWLRINDTSTFTSGIYTGTSILRTDNQLQVGDAGANFYAKNTGDAFIQKTLGINGVNIGYKLYVNGMSWFSNTTYFNNANYYIDGSGNASFNTVGINGTNTNYGLYVNKTSCLTDTLYLNAPIYQNGGYNCSGGGNYLYYKICTIKITASYINRPVVFEISGRGRHFSTLEIIYQNINNADPALTSFTTNWDNCYYIIKTATGTWEVYGAYNEAWGRAVIHRVTGAGSNIGVTINMENVSTLPSGYTQVSYGYNSNYAVSASRWTTARTFTIGNTGKTVDGTVSVSWSIAEIGAAPASHNHTSLTGVTKISFATESSDNGSISTTIDGTSTYFDFNLADDVGQNDMWRWIFTPSGGTVFNAMTLDATSVTEAKLTVTGTIQATTFLGTSTLAQGVKANRTAPAYDQTLTYCSGQFPLGTTAGNAYSGVSNNRNLWCFPAGQGDENGSVANVQVLRMSWGTTYWQEIFCNPNRRALWYRAVCGGTAHAWQKIWIQGDAVTSAVWNDYAECRKSDSQEPGYVMFEKGDDSLSKTIERLQHFAGIISDTWGFSQGETADAKTNIAVAGRVLAYPYRDRNEYKPGDCVCAAPGGKVDIMTREEIAQYPDRIVGTVSCVPEYETWGGGELADRDPVKVNGRIWIKVK